MASFVLGTVSRTEGRAGAIEKPCLLNVHSNWQPLGYLWLFIVWLHRRLREKHISLPFGLFSLGTVILVVSSCVATRSHFINIFCTCIPDLSKGYNRGFFELTQRAVSEVVQMWGWNSTRA